MKMKKICLFIVIVLVGFFSQSCVGDDVEADYSLILKDVALCSFRLGANEAIMKDLDSVFFTIDLIGGEVYNADSLPVGTSLKKLTLDMTFVLPSQVVLYYGKNGKDTLDYMKNTSDTLDMSEGARLKVVSADGSVTKFYDLKVNVHKLVPDSLQWDDMTRYQFPTASDLEAQKTILKGGKLYSFLKDRGVFKLWVAENGGWQEVGLPRFEFDPDLNYMQVYKDKIYVRDINGTQVYVSSDGLNWSVEESLTSVVNLVGVLGGMNDTRNLLVGLTSVEGRYCHFTYDGMTMSVGAEIDPEFPITGYSNSVSFKGGILSQLAIAGGKLQNGDLTNAVWGFDGTDWAILNNIGEASEMFEPREGALLFNYYSNEELNMPLWILIGGKGEKGAYMKDIFSSRNNGVSWVDGPSSLFLPEEFPYICYASVFVLKDMPFGSDAYSGIPVDMPVLHTSYQMRTIDTYENKKEIPYVYIFGGEGLNSSYDVVVLNQIWRGVINRLKFDPIH